MHPAGPVIWMPVMVLLCACANDPASSEAMMDELLCRALLDAGILIIETPDIDEKNMAGPELFDGSSNGHRHLPDDETLPRPMAP